ncbi:toprim domain-containing protein [uncultured Desulfosarcina sp.]|uniref:toprim domain-containing protein n=1 Tax=uncultured Desulfosarcina sp. TaxID=218289 RepID=UPI0029C7865C|nr:toprim domain-containing protein [uncultured Desulfosarcina sp.]
METYLNIKSAATMDAVIPYVEALFDIRFKRIKKHRYNAPCPFHADTQENFMVYVNKENEVRFHCFGACKGDWDITDLIMLRNKYPFRQAQQVWAEHLGVADFTFSDARSPCIPEPGETPEPDEPVGFVESKQADEKRVAALENAADFYHDLFIANEDRFRTVWEYLAYRGVGKETIDKFNIGYSPPYSDEQHHGRALIDSCSPNFDKDADAFAAFSNRGLFRFLNDATVKEYGYYCRQIDFNCKNLFSRNYGDFFAGRMVFPIYDADAGVIGMVGRHPGDRGVRWLKHQAREVPLSAKSWLYGIEKAARYIRHYRTIILVEGLFDYFSFYNLLHGQDKLVVVSTLGSYLTPNAAAILKNLDIENFIAAFDWDELGRNGIERTAVQSGGWVYYLGGLADGQNPYDKLEPVASAISGFSLKRL